MRRLLVVLALLACPAHAQVIGWADCTNRAGSSLLSVRVVLMEGRDEYGYRTRSGVNRVTQVIQFKTTEREVILSGMRVHCVFSDPGLKAYEAQGTVYWLQPRTIPVGTPLALGLSVVEIEPGIWRAFIGHAP